MIIDFHAHCFPDELARRAMPKLEESAGVKAHLDGTLRDLLSSMERAGIELSVLHHIATRPGQERTINKWASEIQGEKILSFGTIHPDSPNWRDEVKRIVDYGLKGVKFHPSLQAFYPNDPRFYPLYEKIATLGVPALFHTGTSGLGAGLPGGGGIKLDYARPIHLDAVAADFPELIIIGAHTGWPWHEELLALIGHKPNVYMDLSGWSPRYIPATVLDAARRRLSEKMLFGSDYPFITPERWLADFEALDGFSPEVRHKILYENAARILRLA